MRGRRKLEGLRIGTHQVDSTEHLDDVNDSLNKSKLQPCKISPTWSNSIQRKMPWKHQSDVRLSCSGLVEALCVCALQLGEHRCVTTMRRRSVHPQSCQCFKHRLVVVEMVSLQQTQTQTQTQFTLRATSASNIAAVLPSLS